MRLLRNVSELPESSRNAVVALGNFDGVHRGHQAVIGTARKLAGDAGVGTGVVTFEPHPRLLFRPDLPPFRLTPWPAKVHAMEALGVDYVLLQTFDRPFAALSARQFVDRILVQGLGVRHAVVGYDFVFGHNREGNADTLSALSKVLGFGFTAIPPVMTETGEPCTSTAIRAALQEGRVRDATRLLGREWVIEGTVEHGEKRGRQMGFPTANVTLGETLEPALGIYAVRVRVGDELVQRPGVAYFGKRPTFGDYTPLLEVHLFDYDGDLYGQQIRVAIVDFIRPDAPFAGMEALQKQIAEDGEAARRILAQSNPPGAPSKVLSE